jgi:hypothetical protein
MLDDGFIEYRLTITELLQSIQETQVAIAEILITQSNPSKELTSNVTKAIRATSALISAEINAVRTLVDYEATDE